jgi:hypothetical protein
MELNYYQILGVQMNAHPTEIQMAYETLKESAEADDIEAQLDLQVAYSTLINQRDRAAYNSTLFVQQPVAQTEELEQTPVVRYIESTAVPETNMYSAMATQFIIGFVATLGVMLAFLLIR